MSGNFFPLANGADDPGGNNGGGSNAIASGIPTARLDTHDFAIAGGTNFMFKVKYRDDLAMNLATIVNNNTAIRVAG